MRTRFEALDAAARGFAELPAERRAELLAGVMEADTQAATNDTEDAEEREPVPIAPALIGAFTTNADLARAIRTKSAAALRFWFGVTVGVVWRWRKVFGMGGRAGTKRAIRGAAFLFAALMYWLSIRWVDRYWSWGADPEPEPEDWEPPTPDPPVAREQLRSDAGRGKLPARVVVASTFQPLAVLALEPQRGRITA
jgi:hypothetical protein